MKLTSTVKKKQFEPITLQLTFESVEDLNALYHRMNVSGAVIKNNTDIDVIPFDAYNDSELSLELFEWVSDTISNL